MAGNWPCLSSKYSQVMAGNRPCLYYPIRKSWSEIGLVSYNSSKGTIFANYGQKSALLAIIALKGLYYQSYGRESSLLAIIALKGLYYQSYGRESSLFIYLVNMVKNNNNLKKLSLNLFINKNILFFKN